MKISEAQKFVKEFAKKNNWKDHPNIDKFDHLHEELIEMSKLLRYKGKEERIKVIEEKKEEFKDGVGDILFGLMRLCNQIGIVAQDAFNFVKDKINNRWDKSIPESKSKENQK